MEIGQQAAVAGSVDSKKVLSYELLTKEKFYKGAKLYLHEDRYRSSGSAGVQSQECRVRSAESGVRSQECRVRSAESGVRSQDDKVTFPLRVLRRGSGADAFVTFS